MAGLVRLELSGEAGAAAAAARCAAAAPAAAALTSHARAAALEGAAARLSSGAEGLARLIVEEARKPLVEARREVERALGVLRLAAEEARRLGGEVLPLDLEPGAEGRTALVRRVPRGPALFITPFNFSLNLAAHKAAPAVAAGLPFVLRPDPRGAKTAARLLEALVAAGWPAEAALLAEGPSPAAEALVRDPRFRVFSFTGSQAVGWRLKALAPRAHVVLELGGRAAVFVASDADLAWAAARCCRGAYAGAGQACVSVQRILVERPALEAFRSLLVRNIRELRLGEPEDEATEVGPMIDEAAAARAEGLVREAVARGAVLWAGGPRRGALLPPALLEGVPEDSPLSAEEAFAPVACLEAVPSRAEALERLSRSGSGLQAGIFTNDLAFVRRAFDAVPAGALLVNDAPSWRSDAAPFGGAGESGLGREGVRWAIAEYTEPKALVLC